MEELENEISTQEEENTVSLASAQALADALTKIEAYTPTTWVDNSSPDIDAEHLNKPEQAIKRVTDALNSAVDVIKDLQSQVTKNSGAISDVNNNLSRKLGVGLRYDSGTLLDIIINLPQGVQMLTLTKDVDGVPFPTGESYIIVFKGTNYTNGAFARIMAFQTNQPDNFKLGMVSWDVSGVFWNDVALKSDLDSSKLKSMTFTTRSDEFAQIAIGNPGILICAVSNNYLLARQDNGVCRVIGNIRNDELSFKKNVEVSGIAFYV